MKKNKFCPNINHPDAKALIDKLGLLGFYKEYIKNNYSIPTSIDYNIMDSTKSVEDIVFINKDLFNSIQQDEIAESIVYLIQTIRNEGITSNKEIKIEILEDFKAIYDDLISSGQQEQLEMAVNYKNLLDNYEKFYDLALQKLSDLGVNVKYTSTQYDNDVVEDSADDIFNDTEALLQKLNYADESTFMQSSKNTASSIMKGVLSVIPKYEYNNGKLVTETDENGNIIPVESLNFINLTKFEPLDVIWNDLLYTLKDIPTGSKLEYLKNSTNPRHQVIADIIESDPNIELRNQFESVFSLQQAKFITSVISRPDDSGSRSLTILDTNRNNPTALLVDDWYNNFINSDIVNTDSNGNKIVNTELGNNLNSSYKEALSILNKDKSKAHNIIYDLLNKIGINISKEALSNSDTDYLLANKIKYIFETLSGNEKYTDIENTLDANNPFMHDISQLEELAGLENSVNPGLFESSFISGDNKSKYSFVNNTYLSHKINRLTNENSNDYLRQLQKTGYASGSYYIDQMLNPITGPTFKNNFEVHYIDTLGNRATNQPNKSFNDMTTREKEFSRVAYFQNSGKGTSKGKSDIGYFIGLIPSDKSTIPAFKSLKFNVRVGEDLIPNNDTIDIIYSQFISEYNRIDNTIKENSDDFITKLKSYHGENGLGTKFIVFDFMNDIMFENGNLIELSPQIIEETIRPRLESFLRDLTQDTIDYWTELGIYNKDLLDKSYIAKKGYKIDDSNINNSLSNLAAEYAINYFVFYMNQTQLISGDPALHGKGGIESTIVNFYKRMAKDIAPGLDGNFEDNNFNSIFLKDLNYSSEHLMHYMEKVIPNISEAYGKINPADAQEYTTLDEHLRVMRAYGRLTNELEDAAKRLQEGGSNVEDIKLILQPMKPVYVESVIRGNINMIYYIKTSSFPLIPALTKGLEIDKLRVAMETNLDDKGRPNPIGRAVYESGVKLGLQNNPIEVSNDGGSTFNDLSITPTQIINLPRSGFRIQQEIPFGEADLINEGSQGRKLILNNLPDSEVIEYNNKKYTGREVKEIYENLHIEKMDRAFNNFMKEFNVDPETNRIEDIEKIANILKDEAISRGYPVNDIYSIQVIEENGVKRFKVPLGFVNNSNRFESLLTSIITNRVIKSKLPGFSSVQGASSGFTRIKSSENIELFENSIIWIDPNDTKLNYITEKDGKLISADILVPNYIKGVNINDYIKEDGSLDTNRIPKDILTVIGIRIPTQGYNSIMKFNVKGFLPDVMGNLAIVPAEITIQMGSDFDVDKLFVYNYHHTVDKDGKVNKITVDLESNIKVKEKSGTELVNLINEEAGKIHENFKKVMFIGSTRVKNYDNLDYNQIETILKMYISGKGVQYNTFADVVDNYSHQDEIELYSQVARKILKKIDSVEIDINNRITNINYSKLSNEQIDNLIVQTFEDRLSDPRILDQILEPNGFGKLIEVSDHIGKLNKSDRFNHTFSTREQNNISDVNNAGKLGVAKFSLTSTFFKAAQDANLKIPSISVKNSKGEVIQLDSLSNIKNIENDNISNVIMFFQSAAVDNANEQILGNLNVNRFTMDSVSAMAMAGLPEDYIGYFMSQPVIKEYVSKMTNSFDLISSDGTFDPNLSDNILDSLENILYGNISIDDKSIVKGALIQLNVGTKELKGYLETNTGNLKLPTTLSEEELSALNNISNLFELKILDMFKTFKELGSQIVAIQSSLNTDTNGLGSNLTAVEAKVKQIENVIVGSEKSNIIYNTSNLYINNTSAKAIEILNKSKNIFSNITPYSSYNYDLVINKLFRGVDLSFNENNLRDVYSNIKSYILSNEDFIGGNVDDIRDSLLYSTNNIAKRWNDYSKSDLGKKNPLTLRIKSNLSSRKDQPNTLKANNTPGSNNATDINQSIAYFYDMINSSNETERNLAEDMVKYHLITGAQYGPNSIGKYITYDVLERYNFSSKLRDIEDRLYQEDILSGFIDQYFQNNPFKAKSYTLETYPDTFETSINNNLLTQEGNPSKYIVSYNTTSKEPVLYKLIDTSGNKLIYSKLEILGTKTLKKYNYNVPNEFIDSNIKTNFENLIPIKESELTTSTISDSIINTYDINNGINSILSNIINKSTNEYNRKLANDLLNNSDNLNNLTVNIINTPNVLGSFENNIININLKQIEQFGDDYLAKFEETFLHELIHGLTVNKLNSNNLSRSEQVSKNKLNRLFDEYRNSVENQEELNRYIKTYGLFKTGLTVSKTGMDFLTNNKSKYYHLTSIKEFLAVGLTNDTVRSDLESKGLWKRIIDYISNLLGITNNDLEFLYNNTIDLIKGFNKDTVDENNIDYDIVGPTDHISQRDNFFKNYNVKNYFSNPHKKYSPETQRKLLKANDNPNYNKLDIYFYNNELRVVRKENSPNSVRGIDYNIADKKPESTTDKFIDRVINKFEKTLKDRESKQKALGDKVNPTLDASITKLRDKVNKLKDERSVIYTIDAIKDRLNEIEKGLNNNPTKSDISEYIDHLNEFLSINDQIDFNIDSQLGAKYDEITDRLAGLAAKLRKKSYDIGLRIIDNETKERIDIPYSIAEEISKGVKDVGYGEANFIDSSNSSSIHIQTMGLIIEDVQDQVNDDLNNMIEEFGPLVNDFLKKYKNYNILLQEDSKGNKTGFLINRYKDEFYKRSKGDYKFWKDNTELTINDINKKNYEDDRKIAEDTLSTEDYNTWVEDNNPYTRIEAIKNSKRRTSYKPANKYITFKPISIWEDPKYSKLKELGEDDPAVKLFNFIEPIIRRNNKLHNQQINYIPEIAKTPLDHLLHGEFKGGLDKVKSNVINNLNLDETYTPSEINPITGEPLMKIPVTMFSNKLSPDEKSYDLARIVEKVYYQERLLELKHDVEPLLNIYYALIKNARQDISTKKDSEPILVDKEAVRLLEQSKFMINNFLYNKSRADNENERLLGRRTDQAISYFRLLGMGWNPFSAIGNAAQGLMSNFIFSTGNQYFNQNQYLKASSIMLHSIAGKTNTANKISKAFIFTDAFVKSNELNFGKSKQLRTSTNLRTDALKPFDWQERGEYFVQGQTFVSVMLNTKIKKLDGTMGNAWDAFDDNMKWKESEYGPNPYEDRKVRFKLRQRIRAAIIDVHGNYARPIMGKKDYYIRALMVFRTWLPQAINNRMGEYTENKYLGTETKGRYRSYPSFIKDETGKINFDAARQNLLWLLKLSGNTSLSELDKRNMRKNMGELLLLAAITSIIMIMKDLISDADDEDKSYQTYLINSLMRSQNELLFFMSPSSFDEVIKDPIPIMSIMRNLIDVQQASIKLIMGDDEIQSGFRKGKSRTLKELGDLAPGWTQVDKNIGYFSRVFSDNVRR